MRILAFLLVLHGLNAKASSFKELPSDDEYYKKFVDERKDKAFEEIVLDFTKVHHHSAGYARKDSGIRNLLKQVSYYNSLKEAPEVTEPVAEPAKPEIPVVDTPKEEDVPTDVVITEVEVKTDDVAKDVLIIDGNTVIIDEDIENQLEDVLSNEGSTETSVDDASEDAGSAEPTVNSKSEPEEAIPEDNSFSGAVANVPDTDKLGNDLDKPINEFTDQPQQAGMDWTIITIVAVVVVIVAVVLYLVMGNDKKSGQEVSA